MSEKKTFWYISKYIAPSYAAKNQARGFLLMKALSQAGHHTVLITSDSSHQISAPQFEGRYMQEQVEGVDVHWVKTLKFKSSASVRRVLSWFDFEWRLFRMPKKNLPKPDYIIVSSLSLLTIVNGFLLRKKYACKLAFEVRDIWPLVLVETGGYSRYHPLVLFLGWVEKFAYRTADLIVGTMPNLSEHVRNIAGRDLNVVCIPQVIDPNLLQEKKPLSSEFIKTYLPEGKFIVCHAGSMGADNALETFIECAKRMKDNKKIHFLLVGEGGLKEQFKNDCAGYDNISFAPRIEKPQVQSLLERSDVVYFSVAKSKLWDYGQSLNKVIDYMLAAKPIVASYSGFPSMINEADCGVYVPAEDVDALQAALECISHLPEEERLAMGMRGREWVLSHRMPEQQAKRYIEVLQALD